ncbi:MAG: WbqC-like protein [Candidatus Saccharibacteria bacterium]|nr:WbqC-like protein [Candidatus Saccharibacteria bacterium]
MTKTVAIMQPYIFPYLGYIQLLNAVDEFVVYDDVQYIVRGWINRNNILVNNEKKLITISLNNSSANKRINEIEIKDDFITLRKTLQYSYAKAPFKSQVLELIDKIFSFEDKNLTAFIYYSLSLIADYIGIDTKLVLSSAIPKNDSLRGQQKIMAICKKLGATNYINPIGGKEIYDRDYFEQNNIDLKFIETKFTEYKQFEKAFVPGLSIIDIMMFNSPEQIKQLLKDYTLV